MNSNSSQVRPPLHNACLAGDEESVVSLISSTKIDLDEIDFVSEERF